MFTLGYNQSENLYTIESNLTKLLRSKDTVLLQNKSKFKVLEATIVDKVMVITSTHGDVYLCKIINSPGTL